MDSLHDNRMSLDVLMPVFREHLDRGQTVRFFPRGTSMLPLLRQGVDEVVLSPLPEKLKRFDLPLYQRKNGQYVLHRIVEVNDGTYTCLGDNQFDKEPGIYPEQMIAIVTGVVRKGVYCSVEDFRYRLYCYLWYYSRHLRRGWRGFVARVKKILWRFLK